MPKGNAGDWSYGDMKADQAKTEYEVTAQHPFNDEDQAKALAKKLRATALKARTGALVEVVKDTSDRRQTSWIVKVHNPKGRNR